MQDISLFLELVAGFGPATLCSPHKTLLFCGDPERIISRYSRSIIVRWHKKSDTCEIYHFFGASGRIRTGDLLITNQLLYRLSHTSIFRLCLGLYQTYLKIAIYFCNIVSFRHIFLCFFALLTIHRQFLSDA